MFLFHRENLNKGPEPCLSENICTHGASQVALVVKNPPANTGDTGDEGLIPGLGRSPGGGNGNPLQYSCLENPMGKGAWQTAVQRVTQSGIQRKQLSTHAGASEEVFRLRPTQHFNIS